MGATTRSALMSASVKDPKPQYVRKKAAGKDSQSNGSLMRITPLAVFVAGIEDEKLLEQIVKSEVSLTHSNTPVQEAAICYCLAIKTLINNPGNRALAYETAKYLRGFTHNRNWAIAHATKELQEWFTVVESASMV